MKILKLIGLGILGLLVLGLIIAAFVPKHLEYEQSTDINAPKEVVFGIVNDLKTQEVWGPWKKQDPTIQNTYNEIPTGVGQKASWTSEKSGNGSQTITESTPPTAVTYKIDFEGEGGGDAWYTLTDGENGGTKATWKFAYDVSYPKNLLMAMMGGMMNEMLNTGLAGVKEMAEQKAKEAPATTGGYEVKTMDFPATSYIGIRQTAKQDEVMKSSFFAERFGKIMTLFTQSKMQPAGVPTGIYYSWDTANNSTDVAVAMPVAQKMAVAGGDLKSIEVPASKAVYIDYTGPYENMQAAHDFLNHYIKTNGLKEKAPVIEQYVTDPATEKDPAKWLTKIIYLIEG